jgi:hypothetical protein
VRRSSFAGGPYVPFAGQPIGVGIQPQGSACLVPNRYDVIFDVSIHEDSSAAITQSTGAPIVFSYEWIPGVGVGEVVGMMVHGWDIVLGGIPTGADFSFVICGSPYGGNFDPQPIENNVNWPGNGSPD